MLLTRTEEDYIKALYRLQEPGGTISTNDLAREIAITPASATDMLKKLRGKKLIRYQAYYGCSLTGEGARIALGIIRKHRLWEFFLCEKLGFGWEAVHEIAEELEHISSPELIDRLDAFLGYPKSDPHGDPIPDSEGLLPELGYCPLTDCAAGQTVQLMAVGEQTPAIMNHLKHYGLTIGARITIVQRYDFDGSLETRINDNEIKIMSQAFARNILVKPLSV